MGYSLGQAAGWRPAVRGMQHPSLRWLPPVVRAGMLLARVWTDRDPHASFLVTVEALIKLAVCCLVAPAGFVRGCFFERALLQQGCSTRLVFSWEVALLREG